MLRLLALLLAFSSEPSRAEDPLADPTAEARIEDANNRLEAAINLYISGDSPAARNELMVLVLDPALANTPPQAEARVWLGEVLYAMGEVQAAEDTFRAALALDPALRLDPFLHPPEVVAFFDAVRVSAQARPPEESFTRKDEGPPWLVLAMPGGVQFYNGQPVLGTLTGGTVGSLGAITLGMRLWMRAQDEDPDHFGVQVYDDAERVRRLRAVRAVENTLGFTALGVWGVGIAQGVLRNELKASVLVGPGQAAVVVRF